MILLDSNVVSELMRPAPHPSVAAYFQAQRLDTVFLPAVCEGEIRYGIARLAPGRRRAELSAAFRAFLDRGFRARVIAYDGACAACYAVARVARERAERPVKTPDLMIAGTALAHGAAVVTRHVADFESCGIALIDPWQHRA